MGSPYGGATPTSGADASGSPASRGGGGGAPYGGSVLMTSASASGSELSSGVASSSPPSNGPPYAASAPKLPSFATSSVPFEASSGPDVRAPPQLAVRSAAVDAASARAR